MATVALAVGNHAGMPMETRKKCIYAVASMLFLLSASMQAWVSNTRRDFLSSCTIIGREHYLGMSADIIHYC